MLNRPTIVCRSSLFYRLPEVLLPSIFLLLPPSDLLTSVVLSCRHFHRCVTQPAFWLDMCLLRWPVYPSTLRFHKALRTLRDSDSTTAAAEEEPHAETASPPPAKKARTVSTSVESLAPAEFQDGAEACLAKPCRHKFHNWCASVFLITPISPSHVSRFFFFAPKIALQAACVSLPRRARTPCRRAVHVPFVPLPPGFQLSPRSACSPSSRSRSEWLVASFEN